LNPLGNNDEGNASSTGILAKRSLTVLGLFFCFWKLELFVEAVVVVVVAGSFVVEAFFGRNLSNLFLSF
jgi:hypothetical protein